MKMIVADLSCWVDFGLGEQTAPSLSERRSRWLEITGLGGGLFHRV